MIGQKRSYQSANSDTFNSFSSKSDLFDYMKNHLQVSKFINFLTFFQYYMMPYDMLNKDMMK